MPSCDVKWRHQRPSVIPKSVVRKRKLSSRNRFCKKKKKIPHRLRFNKSRFSTPNDWFVTRDARFKRILTFWVKSCCSKHNSVNVSASDFHSKESWLFLGPRHWEVGITICLQIRIITLINSAYWSSLAVGTSGRSAMSPVSFVTKVTFLSTPTMCQSEEQTRLKKVIEPTTSLAWNHPANLLDQRNDHYSLAKTNLPSVPIPVE